MKPPSAAARCALAALVAPTAAIAAGTPPEDAGVTGSLLQALLGLGVVLALIWGAAWLMRRLQPNIGLSHGALKVVATQSVGQRERVVLIEVADQWLVVGVAPGRVNALATLAKGSVPAPPAPAGPFANLLARARKESP